MHLRRGRCFWYLVTNDQLNDILGFFGMTGLVPWYCEWSLSGGLLCCASGRSTTYFSCLHRHLGMFTWWSDVNFLGMVLSDVKFAMDLGFVYVVTCPSIENSTPRQICHLVGVLELPHWSSLLRGLGHGGLQVAIRQLSDQKSRVQLHMTKCLGDQKKDSSHCRSRYQSWKYYGISFYGNRGILVHKGIK